MLPEHLGDVAHGHGQLGVGNSELLMLLFHAG